MKHEPFRSTEGLLAARPSHHARLPRRDGPLRLRVHARRQCTQAPVIVHAGILFGAALLGGVMNAVAGGGSFLTFPALIVTGVPPIAANATNTVALWPGSIASVWAYRRDVQRAPHALLLSSASLAGGALGAVLLLHIPSATFARLIPYLLLLTTLLFAFNRPLAGRCQKHQDADADPSWRGLAGLTLA